MSTRAILCVDSGSSSLKYAAFALPAEGRTVAARDALLRATVEVGGNVRTAVSTVLEALAAADVVPVAVGHRVTFGGGRHLAPERIDPALLADLESLVPIDRTHLPSALACMRAIEARFPNVPAVACFDGAFHASMPEIARRLPIPEDLDPSLRRYGYHGLSYEYVASALAERDIGGRIVVAHLGSGASLAALRDGVSVETTMSLTPISGLLMSTRPGDLDPGLVLALVRRELAGGASGPEAADAVADLLERRSGLLAIGGSADMRTLLARRESDPRARAAVDAFVYDVAGRLAALTVALGGLDAVVFTGGIGEKAAPVRAEIAARLTHLGIELDPAANGRNDACVSAAGARVGTFVLPTDENLMLARHVVALAHNLLTPSV